MTTLKRNSRRFYYPTGIISLISLPLLCIWWLDKNQAFKKYAVIDIMWWSPSLHTDNPEFYPKESHPIKNYTDINLTGNDKDDKTRLDYAQLIIRELIKSQDTATGVHFHFSDKSKYWTLIKALDICKIEKAKVYIPYENDIWVLNPKPDNPNEEKPKTFVCGGILMDDVIVVKSDKQIEEERKETIKHITDTVKTYFVSLLLFVAMTLLTIRRIFYSKFLI
jgi:hypothetical protein